MAGKRIRQNDNLADRIVFRTADGSTVDYLPPADDAAIARYSELFFGLKLTAKAVCPDHSSPLQALSDAYFARYPIIVIEGSRGLAGKSTVLAVLSILELLLGADVVVLGGSARQSKRVHDVESDAWQHKVKLPGGTEVRGPFWSLLESEPTGWLTRTRKGNSLIAITASSKSARGPHPQRLRIDEADELDWPILDAALGQPIEYNGIRSQVVISSTHQYAAGTMTKVLEMARQRNWRVHRWCYRDVHVSNGGWLTDRMIADARARVLSQTWITEYELQEPNVEGRVISEDVLRKLFYGDDKVEQLGTYYQFEEPVPGALYSTGCDWGQKQDFTSISTIRYDVIPHRLVAYERANQEPWPLMIRRLERRNEDYPGIVVYDGLNQGQVLAEYIDIENAFGYNASSSATKYALYTDYIMGIEKGLLLIPKIDTLYAEHRYVTHDNLFAPGGHPPDTVCGNALSWQGVLGKARAPGKQPASIGRVIRW